MDSAFVSAIIGALAGSLTTAGLTLLVQKRNFIREKKFAVLLVLMGGRGRIHSEQVSDHINAIPVIFSKERNVRSAYQHFCAVVKGTDQDFFDRYYDLVIEVAKAAGFSQHLVRADVQLGFFPGKIPPPPPPPVHDN